MNMKTDNTERYDFEVLDCTIRDGGYLNNWKFEDKLVREVYRNLSKTGVDLIEIGFRNAVGTEGKGKWYSVDDSLLEKVIGGISGVPLALMIDCGKADVASIPTAADSKISMYRVACHKDDTPAALEICKELKQKGYITSVQLMGIGGYSEKEIERTVDLFSGSDPDYLYFADSYGELLPKDIEYYLKELKLSGKKIGFHAHNSLQLAFANTLESIRNRADIVDATVFGMGRGAGNLALETLLAYLENTLSQQRYNTIPVLDLIDRYFSRLHDVYKWGYSLPYMLSGIFKVHPNYAKDLIKYHEYNMDDMVKILELIKEIGPVGFSKDMLDRVITRGFIPPEEDKKQEEYSDETEDHPAGETVDYLNRHKGRDFLVLANGPSLKEHKKEVDEFINRYDPVILGANYLGDLFIPHYHAFSNKKRFINYVDRVDPGSCLLLSSTFGNGFIKDYTSKDFERIEHLPNTSNTFDIKNGVIGSNCRTVSILLIGVAIAMGAERVFVAGMDGYKNKENFLDHRTHFYEESEEAEDFRLLVEKHDWNEMLLKSINKYLLSKGKEEVHIITPTSHKYFYNSIYNWVK